VRHAWLLIGLAAVVSLGVATAVGRASSDAAALHFYERQGPTTFVDNSPKGKQPTAGDAFVFTNPVYTRHGGRVGSDHGSCTIVRTKPLVAECTSMLQLPQGELMILNLNTGKPSFSAAVVGGTGRFAGAHGTLTTHTVGKAATLDIALQ
jgi:Allene oxide cyclase barrel like domain